MSQPQQKVKKQHSVDEYRQAVKILKLSAMQYVEQNKEIERKIEALEARKQKNASKHQKQIDSAIKLSNNQKTYNRIKQENHHLQQQKEQQKIFEGSSDESSVAKKEQLLRYLKQLLHSKGLNFEMMFRCCDYEYSKSLNIESLKHLLLSRICKSNELSLEQVTLIAQCLDEDCNGIISLEEYNRCITFYNLNEAPNKLTLQRAQEKEVIFKIVKFFDQITKSQRISFVNIFDEIAGGGKNKNSTGSSTALVTQLQQYFESHHLELKDMEMYAVSRVLDPLKTGKIDKKAFVREMNIYHKMLYEIDIDREMQSFAGLLNQFKVDPIQVFKVADIEDNKCVSKAVLIKAIVKLAPRISSQLLDHFLSIIDVNGNGQIDEDEYLVALTQDESYVLFEQNNANESKSLSAVEKQKIIDKMHTFMAKNSITTKELFAKIDRNSNSEISLIEMKFALLDLGFELSQIAQVMKIFDTNFDGKISFQEFSDTLDHGKMLQHGFEKDISEANKNRKQSSQLSDLKLQAELTQVINQSKQDEKKKIDNSQGNLLIPPKPIKPIIDSSEKIPNSSTSIKVNSKTQVQKIVEPEDIPEQEPVEQDQNEQNQVENDFQEEEQQEQEQEYQNESHHQDVKNIFNDNENENDQSIQMEDYDQDFDDEDHNNGQRPKKLSLKNDPSGEDINNKSHNSGSSKKSVKFNLFDEAEIQEFILNEENFDFNKFYEDLGKNKFADNEFQPSLSSLTSNVKKFQKAKNIVWKSASELFDHVKIFEGKVEPGDIKQGGLGDCYFLSSLSVLAERENLIKRLFVTKDANPLGCYSVWICRDSEWVQMILDDMLPCEKQGNQEQPAFSRANGEELWVMLLEKCYAKLYGNYENIEAGQTIEAIKDLTGAPGKSIKNDSGDLNFVWDFILTNERKNYLLTCGSQSDDRGLETKKESGIVSSHAYGILDAREVKTEKGELARLIKIRNPWGSMEWKGDWSDSSKKWTDKIRNELNYFESADDGIFWMDIKDYVKEFSETSVNYLHDDYFYSWLKLPDFNQKQAIVQFVVKTFSHAYIMLSQKSDRHFHNTKYQYSMLKAFLMEINPTTLEPIRYVGDLFTPFREGFIEATLTQGTYALAVEVDWIQDIDRTAVVSIYSNEKHGLIMNPSMSFIDYLCSSVALKDFTKSKTAKTNTYEESSDIVQYYEQFGGYVFFTYINSSKNCTLDEEITLKGTGVELVKRNDVYSSPSENAFTIQVGPSQKKVALYKMKADSKGSISFTIGTGYAISVNESMEELIDKFAAEPDKGDKRENRGKAVDYYFKVCQYNGGFVLLYQNLTKNLVGQENIEFDNTNLEIKNAEFAGQKNVSFKVQPESKYALILEVVDKASPSGLSYSETGTQFSKA